VGGGIKAGGRAPSLRTSLLASQQGPLFFFHCPPSLLPTPELKQAKAHERAPAAARLARFLPRKLRDKLAKGGGVGEVAAEGGAAPAPGGGRYARAPAGPTSDPDKRE